MNQTLAILLLISNRKVLCSFLTLSSLVTWLMINNVSNHSNSCHFCAVVHVWMFMCVFAPSLALLIDTPLQSPHFHPLPSLIDPSVSCLSAALPGVINSGTLSGWTAPPHVPYSLSGYCIWQEGKLTDDILVFLSLKGQSVLTGVGRWEEDSLLLTCLLNLRIPCQ